MKKAIISLIIGVCTICAYSYDFKIDGIYYSIVKDYGNKVCDVAVTSRYEYGRFFPQLPTESYVDNVVIPKYFEYGGYKCTVVGIADNAFLYSGLTSVEIPEGIEYIGDNAFFYTKNLEFVNIPEGVTYIGSCAFNSSNMVSIKLPLTLKEIYYEAFAYTSIQELVIPKSVEFIGFKAFSDCFQMSSLIFEDSEIPLEGGSYIELGTKPRHSGYLYLGRYYEDDEDKNLQNFQNIAGIFLESRLTNESFLKTVEIGPYVKVIPSRTFANDFGLKVINCYNSVPPKYENAPEESSYYTDDVKFTKEVYENAVLYVPEGSLEAYKAHEVWGKFRNIVEGNITIGIDEIAQEGNYPKVYTKGMAIMIEGNNDAENVSVYSIDGRLVYAGKSDCIEVDAAGIYIVRIGNYTTKVIL